MSQQQPPPGYGPPPPQPKAAWFHSARVIGLSLLFCWPFGLILMWTSPKPSRRFALAYTLGGVGFLLVVAVAGHSKPSSTSNVGTPDAQKVIPESAQAAASPDASAAGPRKCAIGVPGDRDASVPIFPTKDGMDEWMRAFVAGDTRAAKVIRSAQQAMIVQGGTACSVIDYGMIHTQVRILEGANEGSAGWVVPEWTHATPVVIAGIAIASAAGAGTHDLAITFNIVEDPEGEKNWTEGVRGFDVTAAALRGEPASNWNKVGAGDRVAFECDSRPSVKELVGCKLTHFEDTNYSLKLKPVPLTQ
jgi:hypothetical protein